VKKYRSHYSDEMKNTFMEYMNTKLSLIQLKDERSKMLFLNIYANPLINYEKAVNPTE
jgi:hypothetical protein